MRYYFPLPFGSLHSLHCENSGILIFIFVLLDTQQLYMFYGIQGDKVTSHNSTV